MTSVVPVSTLSGSLGNDRTSLSAHEVTTLPVLVISPHNQCNCRCAMCDIWRIREPRQLTPADLENQIVSFRKMKVQWVAFSGGEAQLNQHIFELAAMIRREGIRVTLLTAGLLLEEHAKKIASNMDDITVSLDGPTGLHDAIRRVSGAFEKLTAGVRVIRRLREDMPITARCTVQKANHLSLCDTVKSARELGLNSISFLAADVTSSAFNRPEGWSSAQQSKVALDAHEVEELAAEMERVISKYCRGEKSRFVLENPNKLRKIVSHFRAYLGQVQPVAPLCNAPWVSAVIEASGDVRPCFFHPSFGNIHKEPLATIINGATALEFRARLDITRNPICRQCVCSLNIPVL
ncbi:MAG TPA: radical SAM protein [Candidatus Eisenbacteria bacterium]|nr:radical SAM protein [Candidatus Eisenbacteria bacterium]